MPLFFRDFGLAIVALVLIIGGARLLPGFEIIHGAKELSWRAFAQSECPNDPISVPVGVEPSECARKALEKFFAQN